MNSKTPPLPNAPLLDWGLTYHARGWCMIPVDPTTKKPCLKRWKKYQTRRPTEQDLRNWFSGKYRALAVICGAVSGNLGGIDFDSPEGVEWWNKTQPELARTLPTEVTTRGVHVLFHCDPVPTQRPKAQKVELLCTGAYVILTPSPGKHWLNPPNGEIPKIDPFILGLEAFGISRPEQLGDVNKDSHFTEEPEDTEDTEENKEIACASSLSSVNKVTIEELQERIDEAITKTLPTDTGQRDRCVFTFCQWLKAIPDLRDRPAKDLRTIIEKWHTRAYPVIGTKPFEDTWVDFVYAWGRVKYAKGSLLNSAVRKAHEEIQNPPEAADYKDLCTRLLVRICWQLQQLHGDQPFYLSFRTAGQLLGLSHTEAGKRLEMLMADCKLAIATAHTNIWATRYRYLGKERQ